MPVNDLLSNWAYMVMTALAWNLKAWFALLLPQAKRGEEILNMEFHRFMHSLILIPAQIVRAGRRIINRLLSYNSWVPSFPGLGSSAKVAESLKHPEIKLSQRTPQEHCAPV